MSPPRIGAAQLVPAGTAVAAVLAFHALGAKSLWRDEAMSVMVARLDWPTLWHRIGNEEANGALYYLLLRCWMALGSGEQTVRALSAVFAVASVPMVYALGRRLFGRDHAAVATLLLAVNAFVIRYAQEARSYALALFLTTAASYLFLRAMDRPSAGRWAAYVVVGTLSVYAHFFAGLVVAVHFGFALHSAAAAGAAPRRIAAGAFGLMVALVSPLLVPVLTVTHLEWVSRPSLRDFVGVFQSLAGAGGPLLLGAYFLACCAALAEMLRPREGSRGASGRWRYGFLLAWLFLPVLASYLFSLLVKPVFVPRYLIVSLPPLVLLGAAGVVSLRPPWLRAGALAVLVALSGCGDDDVRTATTSAPAAQLPAPPAGDAT
ncbi:MAG TPA: glycosyltransferase family 39 protein, partial [Gemmatimonadales bacterium]